MVVNGSRFFHYSRGREFCTLVESSLLLAVGTQDMAGLP